MTPVQLICLLLFFSILIFTIYYKLDPLSPAKMFLFVWVIVLFLVEFKFSRFQKEWSIYSWLALLIGLISFLIGNFVVYTVYASRKIFSINELRNKYLHELKFNTGKFYYSILIIAALYIFAYVIETVQFGTLPIFSAYPDKARSDFGIFGFHVIVSLQPAIMFFCIEYIFINRQEKKKLFVIISIFLLVLVTYFFLLQRYNYFFLFTLILSFLYYTTNVINWKKIAVSLTSFITMIVFLQSIRLSKYASQFFYVISEMKYSKEYASFTGPYMYIAMNLENYASGVEKLKENAFGLLTFDWIMALTGVKHWASEYFNIGYKKYVTTIYNTYPYLWDYFYDYGFLGISILSLIGGAIISMIYYKMRTVPHIKWVSLYSCFIFVILMSFFTNSLTALNMIANIFVIYIFNSYFLQET